MSAGARRGLAARVRLKPYDDGVVLPHEGTFTAPKEARLRLLEATRVKPSPIFLLHHGGAPAPDGEPDLIAELDGVVTRLWRIDDPAAIEAALGGVEGPILIADGHHRYETALRFHEEDGTEETAYVLAVLVGLDDPGLEIFPTHRLTSGAVPDLDGQFTQTPLPSPGDASAALAGVGRDHPAFVLLRPDGASLVEGRRLRPRHRARRSLSLSEVAYTASADEAERAVRSGEATAAFLVRPPTVDQVEDVRARRRAHAAEEHVLLPQADERAPALALRRVTDTGSRSAATRRARSRPCSTSCRRASSASRASGQARAVTRRRRSTPPRRPRSSDAWRLSRKASRWCPRSWASRVFGDGGEGLTVVCDPIDGSLNAKRGIPFFSLSLAVASGPRMEDVELGFVHDFGSGEEWVARRGEGAFLDGSRLDGPGPKERIEILSLEATRTDLVAEHVARMVGFAVRTRVMGSLALSLCHLAAGRMDAVVSLKPARSVDIAAAQLLVLERGLAVDLPEDPPFGAAPLDLAARSRVVAAATPALCAELYARLR